MIIKTINYINKNRQKRNLKKPCYNLEHEKAGAYFNVNHYNRGRYYYI